MKISKQAICSLLIVVMCSLGVASRAATASIEGMSPAGEFNGYPLYCVPSLSFIVTSSAGEFNEVLVGDSSYASNYDGYWTSYTFNLHEIYSTGIRKVNLTKDDQEDCGTMYITAEKSASLIDGAIYVVRGNEARVLEFDRNTETAKILSEYEYNGVKYPVTTISGSAFESCEKLVSVELPNSLTEIEQQAFWGCSSLESIVIPNGVTEIYAGTFEGCSSLKSVTLPSSIIGILDRAFYGCSSLTSIEIPNQVIAIGHSAFYGCRSLTSIEIPDKVTKIDVQAFSGCSGLTSVVIPNSVTKLGLQAFQGCSSLDSVELPNSINMIEYGVFQNCSSLTSLEIPNTVIKIEDQAFSGCTSLSSLEIPASVQKVDGAAFDGCSNLTSLVFNVPRMGIEISNRAFGNCGNLKKVVIPSNIGNHPFNESVCVEYPAGDVVIEDGIVWATDKTVIYSVPCDFEGEFVVPNTVNEIGANAFMGCSNITSLTIGTDVATIGDEAFAGCTALTKIESYSETPPVCGENIFQGIDMSKVTLTVESSSRDDYAEAEEWKGISNIESFVVSVEAIKLNTWSVELLEGETFQLVAEVLPADASNQDVTWSSSDETVATVSADGVVTALKEGTAQIVATTTDGTNLSATCTVEISQPVVVVPEPEPVMVSTITITPTTVSSKIGDTMQLTATVTPEDAANKTVTWTSTNEEVATVSADGVVAALKEGTAQIVATTTDGTNLSATCTVEVSQPVVVVPEPEPVMVSTITITPATVSGKIGDTMQLTVTVAPADAADKTISWQGDDVTVATVDASGLVSLKSAGSTTIKATANDGSGVFATCVVTVKEPQSGIDSVAISADSNVKIYNIGGTLVFEGLYSEARLAPGTYIIVTSGTCIKQIVR